MYLFTLMLMTGVGVGGYIQHCYIYNEQARKNNPKYVKRNKKKKKKWLKYLDTYEKKRKKKSMSPMVTNCIDIFKVSIFQVLSRIM